MRGVLVTLAAAATVLGTSAAGFGTGPEGGLEVRKSSVRLHRFRGESKDRMKLRGVFPPLQGEFDPRSETVELLVAGSEVLCAPSGYTGPEEPPDPFETPKGPGTPSPAPGPGSSSPNPTYRSPLDPTYYGRPVRGDPGTAARDWTLQAKRDGTWVYRTEGRRLDFHPVRGTIVASGRNLDLDGLIEAGPAHVDVAVVAGGEVRGTVVDFDRRGRAWSYAARR